MSYDCNHACDGRCRNNDVAYCYCQSCYDERLEEAARKGYDEGFAAGKNEPKDD